MRERVVRPVERARDAVGVVEERADERVAARELRLLPAPRRVLGGRGHVVGARPQRLGPSLGAVAAELEFRGARRAAAAEKAAAAERGIVRQRRAAAVVDLERGHPRGARREQHAVAVERERQAHVAAGRQARAQRGAPRGVRGEVGGGRAVARVAVGRARVAREPRVEEDVVELGLLLLLVMVVLVLSVWEQFEAGLHTHTLAQRAVF